MLIVHLASGLLIAVSATLWGWFADYSVLACLGFYVLGGNVGVLGSAAITHIGWRVSTGSAEPEAGDQDREDHPRPPTLDDPVDGPNLRCSR